MVYRFCKVCMSKLGVRIRKSDKLGYSKQLKGVYGGGKTLCISQYTRYERGNMVIYAELAAAFPYPTQQQLSQSQVSVIDDLPTQPIYEQLGYVLLANEKKGGTMYGERKASRPG